MSPDRTRDNKKTPSSYCGMTQPFSQAVRKPSALKLFHMYPSLKLISTAVVSEQCVTGNTRLLSDTYGPQLTNFPSYVKASGRRKVCLCAVVIYYSVVIVCVGYFTCKMASCFSAHLIWKLDSTTLDVIETILTANKEFYQSNRLYIEPHMLYKAMQEMSSCPIISM